MRFTTRRLSIVSTLALLALLVAGTAPAVAQLQACEPDCPNDPFGPIGPPKTVKLPGGCQIAVSYATRLACNTWNDIYIEFMRPVPNPPSQLCQDMYWDLSVKDLLWIVTEALVDQHTLFPKSPGCTSQWRVIRGDCWFIAEDPYPLSSSWCNDCDPVCCLERFEVCFDDCGNVTCFKPQSWHPPSSSCDPLSPEPGPCEPACGNPSWADGGSCPD